MELTLRFLLNSLLLALCMEEVCSKHSQDASDITSKNSIFQSKKVRHTVSQKSTENVRKHKARKNNKRKKNCCENGGLCILGSFCHCKKHFYGRYCEKFIKNPNCGQVKHDQWMKSGCDLCHCSFGKTTCLVRIYPGCDHQPIPTKLEKAANPRNPVTVLRDDDVYDYEEDYLTDDDKKPSAALTVHTPYRLLHMVAVFSSVVLLAYAT